MWVTFMLIFVLHAEFHIAYIRISLFLCFVTVALFSYVAVSICHIEDVHHNTTGLHFSPAAITACFQYPLFFLCYVAARLILSRWMWIYFFWTNVLMVFVVCIIIALFSFFVTPLIIAYLIKTSFPPHIDDAVRLIEHTMDDMEVQRLRDLMAQKEEELQLKSARIHKKEGR